MKSFVYQAIVFSLVLAAYAMNLHWLWGRWMENPNYSHGPLIPLISLFIIFQGRAALKGMQIEGSNRGLYIISAAVLLYIFSLRAQVNFLMSYSMILFLSGIVLFIYGKEIFRHLIFPITYLVFMVPFYVGAINKLSNFLKMLSAVFTAKIFSTFGFAVFRDGVTLHLANGSLEVADPCSGIRSLMALLALGTLVAYYSDLPSFKKVLLVLAVVPLAFLGNSLRVLFFCLALQLKGIVISDGPLHISTGLAVFGFALISLLVLSKWIRSS